jgi:hypothetical protein
MPRRSKANSRVFKSRLRRLSRGKSYTPRVPRKYRGENPRHHSDLFTDENPRGTVHGLRFRSREEAKKSVQRLKKLYKSRKITYAHMRQIGLTMEQRSRHHAHPTKGIRAGNAVWKQFNRTSRK